MKSTISAKDKKRIKEFQQKYIDNRFKIDWNHIKISRANGYEHNRMVCEICIWLLSQNIPFATEVHFKSGLRPDIICPTHIMPIIEVRNTEFDKRTMEKFVRIPNGLCNQIIYVDATNEFDPELIL